MKCLYNIYHIRDGEDFLMGNMQTREGEGLKDLNKYPNKLPLVLQELHLHFVRLVMQRFVVEDGPLPHSTF